MEVVKFDKGTYFEISVTGKDQKDEVVMKLFDTTVDMAKQIERVFEAIAINPNYKKFDTVKIKRV